MTNNGFGPLLIRRGNRATYCGAAILVVSSSTLVAYLTYLDEKGNFGIAAYLFCMSVLAMFVGEVLRRVCLLAEEIYHKRERYGGSSKKIVSKVFSFKNPYFGDIAVVILIVVFALMAQHLYNENRDAISKEGGRYFLLFFQNIAIVPIVGYLAGIKAPADAERSEMNENCNKNLADGLAWGYYFGYLKMVLPHLEHQIEKSSQELRENIYPVKLLILLPKNCFCYETLDKCDNRIESYENLPPLVINRAGVQRRQYHHTVYKITIPRNDLCNTDKKNEEYYCLMEYATPLMSLYDMSQNQNAAFSEEERLNQVRIFYNKLKEILDGDPKCRGRYELILLADAHDDLAETIMQHIKNSPVDIRTVPPENIS